VEEAVLAEMGVCIGFGEGGGGAVKTGKIVELPADVTEGMADLTQAIAEELDEVAEVIVEVGDSILDFVGNRMKSHVNPFLDLGIAPGFLSPL
jgi:hypothetical protein